MGRYNVEHKGQWAAFSTITDSFITEFMDKENYEQWRKEEYGRAYYAPIRKSSVKTLEEAAYAIRLNRNHDEALECLKEAGLSDNEAEAALYNIETKHWCPIPTEDGYYKCPNCNSIVVKGQERCKNESCELKFVWR